MEGKLVSESLHLRHGSTFSGIEGIGLGLERTGLFTTEWMVEIAKYPRLVLARRRANAPLYQDITEVGDGLTAVDVLSGGFPCQDLSVAGKRAGLAGARSGLFWHFLRVADRLATPWLLIENVPGLLSSNEGEDFAVLLEGLTGFRPAVPEDGWRTGGVCTGPRRAAAWRVLDSRYFGVAQRRRRVFVVCHPRADAAFAVLFESESCGGDPAPSRAAWEESAGAAGDGPALSLRGRPNASHGADSDTYIPETAGALGSSGHTGRTRPDDLDGHGAYVPSSYRMRGFGDYADDDTASATKQRDHKDATDLIVAAPLTNGAAGRAGRRREDDENLSVRRLTPTEYERLQGFPDGWTCLEVDEDDQGVMRFPDGEAYSIERCRCADGPRYAACGNAVSVPVARWIGARLAAEHNRLRQG